MFGDDVKFIHDAADPTAPPRGGRIKTGCLANRGVMWTMVLIVISASCLICGATVNAVNTKPTETPQPSATRTLPAPVVKVNNDTVVQTNVVGTLQSIQPGAPTSTATLAQLVGPGTQLSPQTVLTAVFNQSPQPSRSPSPTSTAGAQSTQAPAPQQPIVLIATNTSLPRVVTATPTATDKVVMVTNTPGATQTPYIIIQSPTPAATQTPWFYITQPPVVTVVMYQTVIFFQTVVVTATPLPATNTPTSTTVPTATPIPPTPTRTPTP